MTGSSESSEFFQVRQNVIYERARFNRRNRLSGETDEQYIMVLYGLAEKCDYGEMKEEMIRDCIVVGIRDMALGKDADGLQVDSRDSQEDYRSEKSCPVSP